MGGDTMDNIIITPIDDDYLAHYGKPRRSGRYPYGSGKDPYQRISRGKLSRKQKKKLKAQEEVKNKNRKRSISELSDEEIRKRISRLQLEQQYKKLLEPAQPSVSQSPQKVQNDHKPNQTKPTITNKPKRNMTEMTNDEVQDLINRLKLEKEYRQLVEELKPKTPSPQVKVGGSAVKKALAEAGTTALKDVSTQTFKYVMGSMVNSFANQVAPLPSGRQRVVWAPKSDGDNKKKK